MSGVQHGDPLGLQLIAFVPQQLLHEIKDRFGQTTGAYLDDVTLAGPVCWDIGKINLLSIIDFLPSRQ